MIIIYNKEKEKVQELVDNIRKGHPEYGEINVISDPSELPENLKISGVIKMHPEGLKISDVVEMPPAEDLTREFEKAYQYHIPEKLEIPDTPTCEPEHPYKQTEFQKLSSFNRKEKNQVRKKLEHQALKYQNKHWKK